MLYHHVTNIFVKNTSDHNIIFDAIKCNIALDNVNIIIEDTTTVVLLSQYGNIMFVDSYITNGYDISYNNQSCNLLKNNRLSNNKQYIESLLLNCSNKSNSDDLIKSLDSSVTSYINHLSPIQFTLSVNSSSYYPGQSLIFNYDILDKIGNKISINNISRFSINIKTNSFFSTALQIEQDGSCPLCNDGISINTISIHEDLGKKLKIYYSIDNKYLFTTNSSLSLDIIGCPIMYNPTDNNYTCIPCNTDYYNLYPNNIEYCKSCDPNKNKFIKCKDETITIEQDYWIGIIENEYYTMISSLCPLYQCCQNENGCDYIYDKSSLCANGRDYKTILCSKCKDGYSESMNTTQCIKCDRFIYLEYLFYPIHNSNILDWSYNCDNI